MSPPPPSPPRPHSLKISSQMGDGGQETVGGEGRTQGSGGGPWQDGCSGVVTFQ